MSWAITGASVEGSKRGGDRARNEDTYHCERLGGGEAVAMLLADGAGSATHARAGARLAVSAAREALWAVSQDSFHPEALGDMMLATFARARAALVDHAAARGVAVEELATTLILVLADARQVSVAQIGDGLVAVLQDDGSLVSLSPDKDFDGYVNETHFLTQANWRDDLHLRTVAWAGQGAVIALTDGVELLATHRGKPLPGFMIPLAKAARRLDVGERQRSEALATFLRSERVCRHTDDDKTVVVAVRQPPEVTADAGQV